MDGSVRVQTRDADTWLEDWLRDPTNRIPVHAQGSSSGADAGVQVNWSLLTLLLGRTSSQQAATFHPTRGGGRRRMTRVHHAIAAGHPFTTGVLDGSDLAQVRYADGSTGP